MEGPAPLGLHAKKPPDYIDLRDEYVFRSFASERSRRGRLMTWRNMHGHLAKTWKNASVIACIAVREQVEAGNDPSLVVNPLT